jgi:hypothetical protein
MHPLFQAATQAFFRSLDLNGDGFATARDLGLWANAAGRGLVSAADLESLFQPDLPSFTGPPQTELRAAAAPVGAFSAAKAFAAASAALPAATGPRLLHVLAGVGGSMRNVLSLGRRSSEDSKGLLPHDQSIDDFLEGSDDDSGDFGETKQAPASPTPAADELLRAGNPRNKTAASADSTAVGTAAGTAGGSDEEGDGGASLKKEDVQANDQHVQLVAQAAAASPVLGGLPEVVLAAALARRPLLAARLVLLQKLARAHESAHVAAAAAGAALNAAAAAATAAAALAAATAQAEGKASAAAAQEAAEAGRASPTSVGDRRVAQARGSLSAHVAFALGRLQAEADAATARAERAAADSAAATAQARADASARGGGQDPAVRLVFGPSLHGGTSYIYGRPRYFLSNRRIISQLTCFFLGNGGSRWLCSHCVRRWRSSSACWRRPKPTTRTGRLQARRGGSSRVSKQRAFATTSWCSGSK